MAAIPPVHTTGSSVYHTNDECTHFKKLKKASLIKGTGRNKKECQVCADLNTPGIKLTPANRLNLYAAGRFLSSKLKQNVGIEIPFEIFLQDPMVANDNPQYAVDEEFFVNWEPGITDGPTTARFAVVDYNADTGKLADPAKWDKDQGKFLKNGVVLDLTSASDPHNLQFHQVNAWVVLQRTLAYYEDRLGMGRHIPWGFDGNRLIVVPHAGYGENAFYERESKSLQFYYFDHNDQRIYTCLSSDIINHELGHAILDGIRPYFYESTLSETGAFHEFAGDLTAILMIMRNNKFRNALSKTKSRDLNAPSPLNAIAEQFGSLDDKPYLRSAVNTKKMSDLEDLEDTHTMSEVLTGTMFDILARVARSYLKDRKKTWPQALSYTIMKMQQIALQPLDFLPPVDATFKDYGEAVLRSYNLSTPFDPFNYYGLILKSFYKRGIFNRKEYYELKEPQYLKDTIRPAISYPVNEIGSSRATAYMFLNDNRDTFLIPANQDFDIVDLYDAQKSTQDGHKLPKQTILQYLWNEEVELKGRRFGEYDGELTTMACGGTIVFDENNTILFWAPKYGEIRDEPEKHPEEVSISQQRRRLFLHNIAKRISQGQVGGILGSEKGMAGQLIKPLTVKKEDGLLKFQIAPHIGLAGNITESFKGNRKWEMSS